MDVILVACMVIVNAGHFEWQVCIKIAMQMLLYVI